MIKTLNPKHNTLRDAAKDIFNVLNDYKDIEKYWLTIKIIPNDTEKDTMKNSSSEYTELFESDKSFVKECMVPLLDKFNINVDTLDVEYCSDECLYIATEDDGLTLCIFLHVHTSKEAWTDQIYINYDKSAYYVNDFLELEGFCWE